MSDEAAQMYVSVVEMFCFPCSVKGDVPRPCFSYRFPLYLSIIGGPLHPCSALFILDTAPSPIIDSLLPLASRLPFYFLKQFVTGSHTEACNPLVSWPTIIKPVIESFQTLAKVQRYKAVLMFIHPIHASLCNAQTHDRHVPNSTYGMYIHKPDQAIFTLL